VSNILTRKLSKKSRRECSLL